MDLEIKIELLKQICCLQHNATSPVKISIGRMDDMDMVKDDILITNAPPQIIKELVAQGYMLDLTEHGIIVRGNYQR